VGSLPGGGPFGSLKGLPGWPPPLHQPPPPPGTPARQPSGRNGRHNPRLCLGRPRKSAERTSGDNGPLSLLRDLPTVPAWGWLSRNPGWGWRLMEGRRLRCRSPALWPSLRRFSSVKPCPPCPSRRPPRAGLSEGKAAGIPWSKLSGLDYWVRPWKGGAMHVFPTRES
jgi:hypothetical protein